MLLLPLIALVVCHSAHLVSAADKGKGRKPTSKTADLTGPVATIMRLVEQVVTNKATFTSPTPMDGMVCSGVKYAARVEAVEAAKAARAKVVKARVAKTIDKMARAEAYAVNKYKYNDNDDELEGDDDDYDDYDYNDYDSSPLLDSEICTYTSTIAGKNNPNMLTQVDEAIRAHFETEKIPLVVPSKKPGDDGWSPLRMPENGWLYRPITITKTTQWEDKIVTTDLENANGWRFIITYYHDGTREELIIAVHPEAS